MLAPKYVNLVCVEVVLLAEDNTLGAEWVWRQGLPGSWSVACSEGFPRNLGGLVVSIGTNGTRARRDPARFMAASVLAP